MKEYLFSYSIIIPHRNIPDLLQRCLDSIPTRDDIQVIIVDDNSNNDIVDFKHFPGLGRQDTEVYFDKSGKGAGRARNIGIEHAMGEWVIFADADDFFSDNFSNILNDHKKSTEDIVYFDFKSVESDDLSKECIINTEKHICNFTTTLDESIRYIHLVPWAKIIRRELIETNHFRFDEVKWGNDTFCMLQIGVCAKNINISSEIIYIQTKRNNSLTSSSCASKEEIECRVKGVIKACNFAMEHGYINANSMLIYYIETIYKRKYRVLFMRCVKKINNNGLKSVIDYMTNGSNKKGKFFLLFWVALGKILPFRPLY